VFYDQLRVFAVQRHPINRRLVFLFFLDDAKEFVGTQPKRFPNKITFDGDTNRFVRSNFEFSNRWLGTIPVFSLVLSRSWQKIDLPSRAHSGAPNAWGFSSAFFTVRKPEPSVFGTGDIDDCDVTLRAPAIFRVIVGVKRDACAVRRNFWPEAIRNLLRMGAVSVSNKDLSVAVVCDFPLRVNERRKRDAKKDRNNELLHAFGALTLGKRAFLIKR
jgi:hypothetical protein